MYERRLKENMANLTSLLYELYGGRWDFYLLLEKLEKLMRDSYSHRSDELKKADESFESCGTKWYLDSKSVGMMLYVDLFSDDLKSLSNKIGYFKNLGVNYVHLMPLFDCPKKENDGGYAISSYKKVKPSLGTMADLCNVAKLFRENGIHLVLDFVFNHTSDEHEWAKKAKKGIEPYNRYYYMIEDKAEVDSWNSTLREIFPTVRRGSFTYLPELKKWVWTTFNSFQWDLNYSNPEVFLAMCAEMLCIANIGVDVMRLDALAFVWKEKGTVCESLPKAHKLIEAFNAVARIVCPSLVFKSEAIVHPDEVIKYIRKDECALSYNPLQMALFWSTLATRDTRLLISSLKKRWYIPEGCAWVNYIRCHDDIGWTFSDEDAAMLGINGFEHRRFLNRFFTAQFEGSYANGEPFQQNPTTGDCRICGTMASLAGLEQALIRKDGLLLSMAMERMKMMYGVLFALPGLPLLYSGDEMALLNDYSYKKDKSKVSDSRWVHRIKIDWSKKLLECQKNFSEYLKALIALRGNEEMLGGNDIFIYGVQNPHVFAFRRGTIHVVANFSETESDFWIDAWSPDSTDLLSGKTYSNRESLHLSPYEIRWLKENIRG
ncbi:MAG: alpha-amylase family protein [Treponema sp.]|nr:alpha-amylase family protein [Treponema sp.]